MPHDRLERRSLALHRTIAAKLRQQPALLAIATDNLDRWSAMSGGSQPYWDAWRAILRRPFEEVLTLIEEDSPHMTELRQSTPFAGVLDPKERWHVYDTFEIWNTLFEPREPSLTIPTSSSSEARRCWASFRTRMQAC